jgi:hypothetical protein
MPALVEIEMSRYEAGLLKLEQLEALLTCTTGLGLGHFMSLNSVLQDHLLMLAIDLAHDAVERLTPH